MKYGVIFLICWLAATVQSANLIELEVKPLTTDHTQIVLHFDAAAPKPVGYSIQQPARISLDFMGAASQLDSKYIQLGLGNTRTATVLDTGDRIRVVFGLAKLVPYVWRVNGNELSVYIGEGVESMVFNGEPASSPQSSASPVPAVSYRQVGSPVGADAATPEQPAYRLTNVDFDKTDEGAGQLALQFSAANASIAVYEQQGDIVVRAENTQVDNELLRNLDVSGFATAVSSIRLFNQGNDAYIHITPEGLHDYLAYQKQDQLVIEVTTLSEEQSKDAYLYSGEKISLNFQDIGTRDALQILANYVGFNLVVSDSVDGSMTLRLDDVPWDHALDLVLKSNGLTSRLSGNILQVATTAEFSAQDALELLAKEQEIELAVLQTEYIQINYAKAEDIAEILIEGSSQETTVSDGALTTATSISIANGFLSSRGNVVVDERTNTLVITDTQTNLQGIRQAIAVFDVPIRQVLIEARIVLARTSVDEGLGVRWGGQAYQNIGSGNIHASGSLAQNELAVNNNGGSLSFDDMLAVNLPVDNNTGSFAIGYTQGVFDLELEISALESTGMVDVVSQPKVITQDGQQARIFSGQNVPILGELVEAGLKLEVTPQITPDDRVVLNLIVNQDSVSTTTGTGLTAIDTNSLSTQVQVKSGETLVLGGVYRLATSYTEDKTPVLGDLPMIGWMFRRETTSDDKSELLVFITPTLIEEGAVVQ
ncbi:type IV pilus secretin PilQ [Reinekea thalattae]|uniref:Type IV pilus secretin PilQ n=1 Tax=Reinekea thalattae TaxID=2593301 RepID=A0A5C8Z3M8_9GAMM|nr:type IV pilus secretin PilQ [Reinekea thalattae]TXR51869.1 type IV pilus secretin PilQ [Reinekea thalattae]